jgi:hypothetical protein
VRLKRASSADAGRRAAPAEAVVPFFTRALSAAPALPTLQPGVTLGAKGIAGRDVGAAAAASGAPPTSRPSQLSSDRVDAVLRHSMDKLIPLLRAVEKEGAWQGSGRDKSASVGE